MNYAARPWLLVSALALLLDCQTGRAAQTSPTFNRDIAPIVFTHCVVCHHPGGIAPFSLTSYREVKKRGRLVANVTSDRFMPPWLPEPGHGQFVGERRLDEKQIATISRWVDAGAPEGKASDLKVRAQWNEEWQLGPPDLVVTLPEPYALAADGKDVYRNFVIPKIVSGERYLRAIDFRPGATGAIHHAFVLFDDTGDARRTAARETEPGFPGMRPGGAAAPDAMFTSWQPGKRPSEAPPGLAATLRPSTDMVVQLHMRPSGKPETIQPRVGLYFTAQPPERSAFVLLLRSVAIDIAAGASDYAVEASYKLPVDVELLAVQPHMHYLGKEVHAYAELPNGMREELILIKRWNFNWQGDYRYAAPVSLPKGSTLRMRYTYDNSDQNVSNPNRPPRRVTYGLDSSDEMGELAFQLLPTREAELALLKRDFLTTWGLADNIARARTMLVRNPKDAENRTALATSLAASGRTAEAFQEVEQAIVDDPAYARAHYILGQLFIGRNDAPRARAALERAVELDPDRPNVQSDLGWVLLVGGEVSRAIEHLERALKLNPTDPLIRRNLEKARAMAIPSRE